MAAKSITIAASAPEVLAAISAWVRERDGAVEQATLQNGTRVRLSAPGVTAGLNVYPSKDGGCKVVFDQPDAAVADELAARLGGEASVPRKVKAASSEIAPVLDGLACWVGSDESGKGDYFGPLVVAAVALNESDWRVLVELGVQDSKGLSDARAKDLAAQISSAFPNEVVSVMPKRYNELWREMGNVNRLLAWAHARAIENVLEKAPEATAAVADQFGDESLIRSALMKRGRTVQLVQMPRAERDPAVAAASILARAEFLRRLDALGRTVGARLPKGASSQVEATARALVAKHGVGMIDEVAKRHFKTTQRVI